MKWPMVILWAAIGWAIGGGFLAFIQGLVMFAFWPEPIPKDIADRPFDEDDRVRFVLAEEDLVKAKEEAKRMLKVLKAANAQAPGAPQLHAEPGYCPACKGSCRFAVYSKEG